MRVSEFTVDRLKSITADELVNHGVIKPAPNQRGSTGYICLLCGSGEGGNHANGIGDGAGTFDAENKFYCHACQNSANGGHKLSPIDLFAISRNLQSENFGEVCRQMCDEFGLPCEFDGADDLPRSSRRPTTAKNKITELIAPKEKISEEELLIREDLSVSDDELINFVRYGCGGFWRGLTVETLQKFGCKYKFKWTSPKSRAAKKYSTPTPRVLIPCDNLRGYIARLVAPIDSFDEQTRKYISPKEHAGRKALFNSAALNSDEPIFAVEGSIDAMSIEQCEFRSVALNGAGNGDLLIKAVTKLAHKPKIIILLDSDEPGRKHAPKLRADLLRVGAPCCVRFLADDVSKIDCNEILTAKGSDALRDILQSIADDSANELDDAANDIAAAQIDDASDDAINGADLNFLFQGDASDLDFARRFEFVFGDKVRWLKDDERWLTYGSGVWAFGSDKNSAVAPFARQVADAMIRHAATKFEVKLAGALKSAAKISASITMMKSLDSILITSKDLDNHPELLNCSNGVVDLTNGKFYPSDSSLLLTQQVNAAYDANATSELVDNFFKSIQPNEMTRAGLLRWLGYCLSGEVNEEKFLVWQGGGGNGKGVLSHTILELFGSYGVGLTPTALLKSNRPADANAATTSLNSLEKSRFAISEELPLKAEIDISIIKNLTGGDRINLRRNYGEYRTIKPSAKINISGNYLPRVENVDDDGLLRRLLNMPFKVKFGTAENPRDDNLKKKMLLPENLNALLCLLVHESIAWYRDGLIVSDEMKLARDLLLNQSDFVQEFIDDNYVRAQNAFVKAKNFIDELKTAYPSETSRFGRADLIRLIERVDGVTYCVGTGNVRIFKGIGKLAGSDFDGEPVNPSETAMP